MCQEEPQGNPLVAFTHITSIHGPHWIFHKDHHRVGRALWALVMLLAVITVIFMTVESIQVSMQVMYIDICLFS